MAMQVTQQDGLGLSIKDFMLHVGSFDPGLLTQWSGNQKLASPQVGMLLRCNGPVYYMCTAPQGQELACNRGVHSKCLPFFKPKYQTS